MCISASLLLSPPSPPAFSSLLPRPKFERDFKAGIFNRTSCLPVNTSSAPKFACQTMPRQPLYAVFLYYPRRLLDGFPNYLDGNSYDRYRTAIQRLSSTHSDVISPPLVEGRSGGRSLGDWEGGREGGREG